MLKNSIIPQELMPYLDRIRDATDVAIVGGSFAVDLISGYPVNNSSDIDIYIQDMCTRQHFQAVLKEIIFPEEEVTFTISKYENQYLLPIIRKRVQAQVKFRNGVTRNFDFIICRKLSPEILLANQASTATQAGFLLTFSPRGYHMQCSKDFEECHTKKVVYLNVHESICTSNHAIKIYEKYIGRGYRVTPYCKPVEFSTI